MERPRGAFDGVVAVAWGVLKAGQGLEEVVGRLGGGWRSCFAGGRVRSLERRRRRERGEKRRGGPGAASVGEGGDHLAATVAGDDQMVVVEE